MERNGTAPKAAELLDLRFGTILTPVLLPMIYRIVAVSAIVLGLTAVVVAAVQVWWLGLFATVVVPVAVIVVIGLTRVVCELLWYVVELHADVDEITERFCRLETMVTDVAAGMPRLKFLRRGGNSRDRSVPEPSDAEVSAD